MRKYFTLLFLIFIGTVLYYTVSKISEEDDMNSSTYIFHTSSYLNDRVSETGIKNLVEAILIEYRSLDTLVIIIILLTSVISVSSLLRSNIENVVKTELLLDNTVLKTIALFIIPLCFLFSFYIFYRSDLYPGGGFQGGLMLGASIITLGFAFGGDIIEKKLPFTTLIYIISVSFILITLHGSIGFILGRNFFSYYFPEIFGKLEADIIRYYLRKLFVFNIAVIVSMVISSLFYIMEGVEK
ncbi:hypothetical protein HY745_08080 [Candidatus Desantisbacteria bacterium]|nr:hypothetical protein [Candidatus Desantisbacteria bacterium]